MILKKIVLENIRSYTGQEIEFPEGSILLAGDIGSGKSTILLSIEFALFGLKKGSGASLLRNGADEGSVELHFDIDENPIIIKRTLKRTADSISQDSGYIIINNEKKELTPQELKQFILTLINYPQEYLTKSKSLIYRYTVYTPQEEMKLILTEEKEARIETLRKVFGIDRYKQIKDNTKIVLDILREKRKELAALISDLEPKLEQSAELKKETKELNDSLKILNPKLDKLTADLISRENAVKNYEDKIKKIYEMKQTLAEITINIKNKQEQISINEKEIPLLDRHIDELKKETPVFLEESEINEKIEQKNNEIAFMEQTTNAIIKKLSEFEIKTKNSEDIKSELTNLSICPTCKQDVPKDYKRSIIEEENKKIGSYKEETKLYTQRKTEAQHELNALKQDLVRLNLDISSVSLYKLKQKSLNEKIQRKEEIINLNQKLEEEIHALTTKSVELRSESLQFTNLEKDYHLVKDVLTRTKEEQKQLELERNTLATSLNRLNKQISVLDKEIEEKQKSKDRLLYYNQLANWLDPHFTDLVSVIERKVMVKIHYDFNSLFQKWFNLLMNSENISISLDEDFTPIIEQNSHTLEYDYLSGGEKTAAALAYRLALNQVINNLVSTIKTKDLLILDEPTDGFSSEQLDRLKVVLEELDMKQIILVSHDPKIETFVDTIIKLNKQNHVTQIV